MYSEYNIELKHIQNIIPDNIKKKIDDIKVSLSISNLKSTTIIKPNKDFANIYKLLNKISDTNYNKIKDELLQLIENININDIDVITKHIFKIASTNKLHSSLYSNLYKELINKNNNFYYILQDNIVLYNENLRNIKYVSPDNNYDDYCSYIKNINSIKSSLLFFTNLYKINICKIDKIENLCNELITLYSNNSNTEEYKYELLQSINIIINELFDDIIFCTNWSFIYNKIVEIKDNHLTSKKIKFKCMDIIDFVKEKNI
jgi:hypothetical protein